MPFNPDQYLQQTGNSSFNPDAYIRATGNTTLAGKALDIVKTGLSYPLGLPGNPEKVAEAVTSGSPSRAYYELMPQMEKGAAMVKNLKEQVMIGRLTKGSYAPDIEKAVNVSNFLLDVAPFEPSSFSGAFVPVISDFMRSSSVVEKGLGEATKSIGMENLTPEQAGTGVKQAYDSRVGNLVNQMTEPNPQSLVPVPKTPIPEGADILNPKLNKVAQTISQEPVTSVQSGQTIQNVFKRNVKDLLTNEKAQWNKLSDEHFDAPAPLNKTKSYIESIFQQSNQPMEGSYLDKLNVNLRETASKQPNPEQWAKSMYEQSERSNLPATTYKTSQEPLAPVPQLNRGTSVLQKVYEASNDPNLNFGQAHGMKGQLSQLVKDWGGRGDPMDHVLKETIRNMTEDMADSGEKGGFSDDIASAVKSTRDYYSYVEKPSSKIISNANYPEDLMNRLIKTDSPTRVNELFNEHNMNNAEKATIQRGLLDKIASQAKGDPNKFQELLDKYSPETKKAFFGDKYDLVESIKDTAKTLNDAIAQSKVKQIIPEVPTKEAILSKQGFALDKMMTDSNASELVSNILKDGSPEIARTATSAIGEKGMQLLRRGAVNEIISKSKIPTETGYKLDAYQIAKGFNKLDPQFTQEFFGKDAKTVQAISDSSKFFESEMNKYGYTPYSPVRAGGISARAINWIFNIAKTYRLPSRTYNLLENSFGRDMAQKIVPTVSIGGRATQGVATLKAGLMQDENR